MKRLQSQLFLYMDSLQKDILPVHWSFSCPVKLGVLFSGSLILYYKTNSEALRSWWHHLCRRFDIRLSCTLLSVIGDGGTSRHMRP